MRAAALLTIIAAAAVAVAAAPAGAVVGGEVAAPRFAAATTKIDTGDQICTGALLTARLVLTAAHCFEDELADPQSVARRTAAVIGNPNGGRPVQERRGIAVGFGPSDGRGRSDVAILVLDRSSSQPLAAIAPSSEIPGLVAPGAKLLLAGFGATVSPPPAPDGSQPPLAASGPLKRAALMSAGCPPDAAVHDRPAAYRSCAVPSPVAGLDAAETGNACIGDSGAPVFAFSAAINRLTQVGVVSGAVGPDQCSQSNITVLTPLTGPVIDWVRALQSLPEAPEGKLPRGCGKRRAAVRRAALGLRRARRAKGPSARRALARARARHTAAVAVVQRHC